MLDSVMDNISQNQNNKNFDSKINVQRNKAYKIIANSLNELKTNFDFFKKYITVQSRFDMYTVRNALLIASQMPNATQLKEQKKWEEADVSFINENPRKILLLDPKEPIKDSNGKTITRVYAKEVIDISETDSKLSIRNYDKLFVLEALLTKSPVPFKKVDSLPDNKICEWDINNNIVNVCKHDNANLLIQSVIIEIAKIKLNNKTNVVDNDLATCISFMCCKRYQIEPQIDVCDALFKKYSTMSDNDIISDLTLAKGVLLDINNEVEQYLEARLKHNRSKEQKR